MTTTSTTTDADPDENGGATQQQEDSLQHHQQQQQQDLLDQSFLYQNRVTGIVAPAPLKVRQLCKILCPTTTTTTTNVITPDTQIYNNESWVQARNQPVLREACAQWHYNISTTGVQGPVSCRELARLVHSKQIQTNATQVWSTVSDEESSDTTDSQSGWSLMDKLPYLMAAIEAFREDNVVAMPAPDVSYDDAAMTFQSSSTHGEKVPQENGEDQQQQPESQDNIQQELEAFLSSTAHLGPKHHHDQDDDDEDEAYQSDGGTQYVRDPLTGNWIHEALAPPSKKKPTAVSDTASISSKTSSQAPTASKKRKKPKFSARNAKCWVYLTGLPSDATFDEVSQFGSKVGIIELDPETQRPKVKLYRHRDGELKGQLKGDASICYARPESVDLALQILDEAPFRLTAAATDGDQQQQHVIHVQRAKFEQHGNTFDSSKKSRVSDAKRKVARLAALQAVGWDEDDINGRITGGRKGLRIIVLKHMFELTDLKQDEDAVLEALEKEIRTECEKWGAVEKITIFSKNPQGIVVVKFTQPTVASKAVEEWDGRDRSGRRVEASFWDGVTDFTVRDEEKDEKETEKRLDEFGQWLEEQEVPDEFKLQVEDS